MRSSAAVLALILGGCAIPRYYSLQDTGDTQETGDCTCDAPENTWPSDPDAPCIEGETGFREGEALPDFRLPDQHGDEVTLCQLRGHVVLVDISTIWCSPCQDLAKHTEATWQDYKDQGFVLVTILAENLEGEDPTVEDLEFWAETFGITAPILGDPGKQWSRQGMNEGDPYPLLMVLDRDLVVRERVNAFTDAAVRAAIEAEL